MSLTDEQRLDMYRKMLLIRKFEEKVRELFAAGKIPGFVHLYIGEEAIAVGVATALRKDDYVTSTHRGHGHCIARGADVRRMMAELFGKREGYCKGKGGSMHMFDISLGILGANGIVAAGCPLAVGAGLTAKLRKTDQVVTGFFGDGATNHGTVHESLNLSAVWKLPVIWVCENNLYAEATPIWATVNISDIAQMAGSYNIPSKIVDGNDVLAVYDAVKMAVDRARKGEGPTFIECKTYRHRGHYEGDPVIYRTREQEQEWFKKDPIPRFESRLLAEGKATEAKLTNIRSDVEKLIDEAIQFAENSPASLPKEALEDVFVVPEEAS
jgi:pyruvate dehydrogenase E1 component alpha subunit